MSENGREKVQVRHLTKKFGDLTVLDDVSFSIRQGEFLCIVGPTGCGKTTFLNLLVKLLEPTAGQILIDGEEADPQKHNLSFVFQEPSAFPWLTVEQNIRFGMETKGWPREKIQKKTDEILELVGLGQYRDKSSHIALVEYRQMFNNDRSNRLKKILSHLGFVAWGGCGFMGPTPGKIEGVLPNAGLGLRIEVQPRMNVRLDFGRNFINRQNLFYFNMTEAF